MEPHLENQIFGQETKISKSPTPQNPVSMKTQKILEHSNISASQFSPLNDYKKIAEEVLGINITTEKIKLILFDQNIEEFRDFIGNEKNKKIFTNSNNSNFDIFLGKNGLLKNKSDFESFFSHISIDEIESFFNSENIHIIFGENGIIGENTIKDCLQDIRIIGSLLTIILKGDNGKVDVFFGKNKIITSLDNFKKIIFPSENSNYFPNILKLPLHILNNIFGENNLINSTDGLIRFLKFKNIELFLEELKKDYSIQLLSIIKNNPLVFGKSMEEIFNNLLGSGILCYSNIGFEDKYIPLEGAYINGFTYNELTEKNLDLLFPEGIHTQKKSKVWTQLIKYLKKYPYIDIHDLMRQLSLDFLKSHHLSSQNPGNMELAMYLRYGKLDIDFPEIGELITIFLQEAIKINAIKGVNGIKIIPRKIGYFPRKSILDKNSRFINCTGDDFTNEIQTNCIAFHLSNSDSFTPLKGQISILSGGMSPEKGAIPLGIELEKKKEKVSFIGLFNKKTEKKTIDDIFHILVKIIGEINSQQK